MDENIATEVAQTLDTPLSNVSDKILFLVIVVAAALVLEFLLSRFINGLRKKSDVPIPSVTLFRNILRIAIWTLALIIVLKPVFGIEATALMAALGAGGIALSLGMQDTIANLIAGLQLTSANIVKPGDFIRVSGVTGQVTDITWRQTTLITRLKEKVLLPNSLLNTSIIERIPPNIEGFLAVPVILEPETNIQDIEDDLITAIKEGAKSVLADDDVSLKITAFTEFGTELEIWCTAIPTVTKGTATDVVNRAIEDRTYLLRPSDWIDEKEVGVASRQRLES